MGRGDSIKVEGELEFLSSLHYSQYLWDQDIIIKEVVEEALPLIIALERSDAPFAPTLSSGVSF